MSVPDAAIEAAADGLWDHQELHMVGGGYECYCGERVSEGYAIAPSKVAHGKHQARAAVEAAMPAIREQIIGDLREFLPEWNYPSYVVAAICLELKARGSTP